MLKLKKAISHSRRVCVGLQCSNDHLRSLSASSKVAAPPPPPSATATSSKSTALYDFHVKHRGKIVDFGGYLLPVQYGNESIIASHRHTRRYGSVFDVSHMLQTYVRGRAAITCMESLCTADLLNAPTGSAVLTCFTNANGGILDDLIITKVSDELLYVVSNAAMKAQDTQLIDAAAQKFRRNGEDIHVEFLPVEEQSLIAVQGPKAVATLLLLLHGDDTAKLESLHFMNSMIATDVAGVPNCRITRCGYTGEDGVEISVPSQKVQHITEALLQQQLPTAKGGEPLRLQLAGLGARDTLRLEAGLCLYGTDLNADITPVEGGLTWLIAKRRRQTLDFPGAERIVAQIRKTLPLTCRRFGLVMQAADAKAGGHIPAARHGVEVVDAASGAAVGHVTSGCPSPTLNANIAMAYWQQKDQNADATKLADAVKKLQLRIRGKLYDASVTRMPFVPSNYKLTTKT